MKQRRTKQTSKGKDIDIESRRKEMEATFKALGKRPITSIVDRLAAKQRSVIERSLEGTSAASSRSGKYS